MKKIEQKNSINFTLADIAKEAENSAMQCYGVIDLCTVDSSHKELINCLKKNGLSGAIAHKGKFGYEIDLYIVIAFGIRVTEVLVEIQKKVKYDLERKFKVHFAAINVYVQGVKSL